MMEIVTLGTGIVAPEAGRAPSCHLVRTAGASVLLDCGPVAALRLVEAGCPLADLDAVALSHLHGDHSAGLVPLLQGMWSHPPSRRSRRLTVAGPARLPEVLEHLGRAWPSVATACEHLVDLHVWDEGRLVVGPLTITPVPVPHHDGSVALRVAGPGGLIVYSGDVDDREALAEAATGADLLVVECGRAAVGDGPHVAPDDISWAAQRAGAGRVVLVHIPPEMDRDQAGRAGEVAEDLSVFTVG